MWLLAFYMITFVVGVLSQGTNVNKPQRRKVATLIPQCFHEGRWFPAGSIISAGRSSDWCFGSFCDINGKVKHWDDYNCPQANGNKPNPPFPNILLLSQLTTTTTTTTPRPITRPQPTAPPRQQTAPPMRQTAPPTFWFPTTTLTPFLNNFSDLGCFYRGSFYWAGQDIENRRRGRRCFGTYCDFNARVQHWQDSCIYTMTPPTPVQRSNDPT